MQRNEELKNVKRLVDVVEKLRSPGGCPWDREQTHKSLREFFIEETYEAVDAIDSGNDKDLKEELGDVLLQVALHSQLANEENKFTFDEVAKDIADKIIRRHPHVFSDVEVKDSDEVLVNWDRIKGQEKTERKSALDGVIKSQPALMAAHQLSKKAIKVGFEWPDLDTLWECMQSEVEEFKQATKSGDYDHMEEELGDILFSLVNVARWHKINPEIALMKANKKFTERFQLMEQIAPKDLTEYNIDELEEFWQSAKKMLKEK